MYSHSLVTWKRPARTRFLIVMLVIACMVLSVIPLKYVAKTIPLHIWFEFFVLQGLRSHYPRHRRLFNVLNLLLWDVPNDAEYALEVVRLSHHTVDPSPSSSSTSSSTATAPVGLRHRESHQQDASSPLSRKSFSSMSEISDTLYTSVAERATKPPQQDATLQDIFTANVKTLALLATASAVNKVKTAVEQRGENKEPESSKQSKSEEDEPNCKKKKKTCTLG